MARKGSALYKTLTGDMRVWVCKRIMRADWTMTAWNVGSFS